MDENDVRRSETEQQVSEPTGLYRNETNNLRTVRTESETRVSMQTASQDAESRIVFYKTDADNVVERAAKLSRSNHFEDENIKYFVDEMAKHSEILSRVGAESSYSQSLFAVRHTFRKMLSELVDKLEETGSNNPVYGDYLEAVSLAGEMIGAADRYYEDGKKLVEGEKTRFTGNFAELKDNFKAFAEYYSEDDYDDFDFESGLRGAEYVDEFESKKEMISLAKSVLSADSDRIGDLAGTVRRLKGEMQELDEKIPEGMKTFFSGVTTWPEFEEREKEYRNIDDERTLTDSLRKRVSEYLGSMGFNFQLGNFTNAMSSYIDPKNDDHFMIAWDLLHSEYAADIPDEVIRHVNDFLEANAEQYKLSLINVRQHSAERSALPLMWQRMALEYRVAIMLAEDPAAEKGADAIESVLDTFGKELEAGEALEQPSAEYDAFVKALKNAGEEGGMEALAESAQEYVSKEEEKHLEGQENYRVDVAKQILTVTRTARAIEQHHAERMELSALETASKPVREERPSVKAAEEPIPVSVVNTLESEEIKSEAVQLRKELEKKALEKARIEAAKREEAEREVARREAERLKEEQDKKAQEEAQKAADEVRTAEEAVRLAEQNRHRYDFLLKDEQNSPIPVEKHPDGQVRPYFPVDRVTERARRFLEGEILGLVARENPDASYEDCLAIASKMMGIFNNNLTGNKSRDKANLYAEYRDAFMIAPEGGKAPLEAAAVRGGILLSLERLIQDVENYDDTLQRFGMRKDDPDSLKTIEDIQLSEIRAKSEAYRKYTAEIEAAGPILEELLDIELTGNYKYDNLNMARVISRAFPSASVFQAPALTRHFSIADYAISATNPLYNIMITYSNKIDFVKFRNRNASVADLQEQYKDALREALGQARFPLNSDFAEKLVEITKRDDLTPKERSFLLESTQDDLVDFQNLYMELEDFNDAFEASVLMHEESALKAAESNKEKVKIYIKENQQILAKAAAAKAEAEKTEAKPEAEKPVTLSERAAKLNSENHIPDKGVQALLRGIAFDAETLAMKDPGRDISSQLTNIQKNYPAAMAFVNKKLASTDPADPVYEEYREVVALGSELIEQARNYNERALEEAVSTEAVSAEQKAEPVPAAEMDSSFHDPDLYDPDDDDLEYQAGSAKDVNEPADNVPDNGGLDEMVSSIRAENGTLPYIAMGDPAVDNQYAFVTSEMLVSALMRESYATADEIVNAAEKMKQILDYNLTGDFERDSEHITREYEKLVYDAPEGGKPLLDRDNPKPEGVSTLSYLLGVARRFDERAAEIAPGLQGPALRAKLEQDLPEKIQKKFDGFQEAAARAASALDTIRKELADITPTGDQLKDAEKLDTWFSRTYPERVYQKDKYRSLESYCAFCAWEWKDAANTYLSGYERDIAEFSRLLGGERDIAALQEKYRKNVTSVLQNAKFSFTPDFCEKVIRLTKAEDLTLEQKNYLLTTNPDNLQQLQGVFKEGEDIRASFDKFMQQREEEAAASRSELTKKVGVFLEESKNNPVNERSADDEAEIEGSRRTIGEGSGELGNHYMYPGLAGMPVRENAAPVVPEAVNVEPAPESNPEPEKEAFVNRPKTNVKDPFSEWYEMQGNQQAEEKDDPERFSFGTEYNPFADNSVSVPEEQEKPAEKTEENYNWLEDPFGWKAEAARRGVPVEQVAGIMIDEEIAANGSPFDNQNADTAEEIDWNDPFGLGAEAENLNLVADNTSDGINWDDPFGIKADTQNQVRTAENTSDDIDWNDPFGIKAEAEKRGISVEEASDILTLEDMASRRKNTEAAEQPQAPGNEAENASPWSFEQFDDVKIDESQAVGNPLDDIDWNNPFGVSTDDENQPQADENKSEVAPTWNFELFEDKKAEEVKVEEAKKISSESGLVSNVRDLANVNMYDHNIAGLLYRDGYDRFRSNPEMITALQKLAVVNGAEKDFGKLADELGKPQTAEKRSELEKGLKDKVKENIRLAIDDTWNQVSYSLDKIDYTDDSFETLNNIASYLEGCRRIYSAIEPEKAEHRMVDRKVHFTELYNKLNTLNKTFTSDTEEFTAFKNALNTAANGGDVKALYDAAKKYESEKTKNGTQPNTQNGKNRLTVAKRVLALIDPEEFIEAPVVEEPKVNEEVKVDNKPVVNEEVKVENKPVVNEEAKAAEAKKSAGEVKPILQKAWDTINDPNAPTAEVRAAVIAFVADDALSRVISYNQQIRDEFHGTYTDFLLKNEGVGNIPDERFEAVRKGLISGNKVDLMHLTSTVQGIGKSEISLYAKLKAGSVAAEKYIQNMPANPDSEALKKGQKACVEVLLYKYIANLPIMDQDGKTYRNLMMCDDGFFSGELSRFRKVISGLNDVQDAMENPLRMKQLMNTPERKLVRDVTYAGKLQTLEEESWAALENESSTPEEISNAVSGLLTASFFRSMKTTAEVEAQFKSYLSDPKGTPTIMERDKCFENCLKDKVDALKNTDVFKRLCADPQNLRWNMMRHKDPNILKTDDAYSNSNKRAFNWLAKEYGVAAQGLEFERGGAVRKNQPVRPDAYSRKNFADKLNQLRFGLKKGAQALLQLADMKGCTYDGRPLAEQVMENAEIALVREGEEHDRALDQMKTLISRACNASVSYLTNRAADYDREFGNIAESKEDMVIRNPEMLSTALECYHAIANGEIKIPAEADEKCAKHISSIVEKSDKVQAHLKAQAERDAASKKHSTNMVK